MKIRVLNLKYAARAIRHCIVMALVVCALFFSAKELTSAVWAQAVRTDTEPLAGRVIVIDAGHGGEDPGAIGSNGVYEKDLNLLIAAAIGEQLTAKGYTVVYTRTEDKMLYSEEENVKGFRKLSDLKNRCKIANGYESSILISVHMNSFGDAKYSGLQTYYKPEDKQSEALAQSVQSTVRTTLQPENDRAIKNGHDIYVLEHHEGVGILIECGFLTNSEECSKLSEKEYQNQLSFSIVCGIIDYINKTT